MKGKLYSFIQKKDSIKYNRKGIIERFHKKTKTHIPDPKGTTHTRAKLRKIQCPQLGHHMGLIPRINGKMGKIGSNKGLLKVWGEEYI